jgi:hypothetical protein
MDLVNRNRCHVGCILVVLGLALGSAASAGEPAACSTERWRAFVSEGAARFDIPGEWLNAVIRAESAGCLFVDGRPITSAAGAMGLMQLMPATWLRFRQVLALGAEPYDPHDNIVAGAAYVRELYDRYGSPGFIAAYHAGPLRYEAHLVSNRPLPRATLEYVARVLRAIRTDERKETAAVRAADARARGLFFTIERTAETADVQSERSFERSSTGELFVVPPHGEGRTEHSNPELRNQAR